MRYDHCPQIEAARAILDMFESPSADNDHLRKRRPVMTPMLGAPSVEKMTDNPRVDLAVVDPSQGRFSWSDD